MRTKYRIDSVDSSMLEFCLADWAKHRRVKEPNPIVNAGLGWRGPQ